MTEKKLASPVHERDVATALHAVRLTQPRISDAIAVVGNGPLALVTVALLLARGVGKVVLVAVECECGQEAAQIGAQVLPPPVSEEALRAMQTGMGGYGADLVFECDGKSEECCLAIELARPAGMVILMGRDPGPVSLNTNRLVFPDKRVKGSGVPTAEDVQIARDMIKTGRLRLNHIITDQSVV